MAHQRHRVWSLKGPVFEFDYQVSKAVRAGNLVFVEGQTGMSMDGQSFIGAGDPAAQAENAMQCVKILLEEVGAQMEDICKINTYVTEAEYRDLVYPVIAKHLQGVYPCSTGVIVKALGKPEADFEIDVFAVIPEERA
jgi:enamine deaminase RidA (YjgF/YER057c/UK114 family)